MNERGKLYDEAEVAFRKAKDEANAIESEHWVRTGRYPDSDFTALIGSLARRIDRLEEQVRGSSKGE